MGQSGKTGLMASVNAAIAGFARDYAARFGSEESVWWFVCECGSADCAAHVDLQLEAYEAIRAESGGLVLAAGHTPFTEAQQPPLSAAS